MCGKLGDPSAGFRVKEKDPSLWGGVVETKGIGLSIMGYRREESSWEGVLKGIE